MYVTQTIDEQEVITVKKKNKRPFISPDFDPMGSYTGVVTDEYGDPVYEVPDQDADDL